MNAHQRQIKKLEEELQCAYEQIQALHIEVEQLNEDMRTLTGTGSVWGETLKNVLEVTFPDCKLRQCWCGELFIPRRKTNVFHSNKCKSDFHNAGLTTKDVEQPRPLKVRMTYNWK